jgi:hypothetical protein
VQGKQLCQSVPRGVHLGALLALGSIVSATSTALWGRAQCTAIKDRGTGLCISAFLEAQQSSQVCHHRLKYSCSKPSLSLLVDRLPGWELVSKHPPERSGSEQPP